MSRPPYEPYLEASGTFRWRLGLRPLDLEHWIEIDDRYDDEIAQKHQVMRRHPGTAFLVDDDAATTAACEEVRDLVVEHLRTRVGGRLADVRPDGGLHPLDAAARLVQEDLVVMVERDGELVCTGGSVCFPNRWDLASKLGLPMRDIHEPVARLNTEIGDAIDRSLERLAVDRPFWRLGWGLIDTDELYQPVDGTAPPGLEMPTPEQFHLRVERETLRRLPATGAVLFTIRTHLTPLPLVAGDGSGEALAAALASMPDVVAEYKGLDRVAPAIVDWLRTQAA